MSDFTNDSTSLGKFVYRTLSVGGSIRLSLTRFATGWLCFSHEVRDGWPVRNQYLRSDRIGSTRWPGGCRFCWHSSPSCELEARTEVPQSPSSPWATVTPAMSTPSILRRLYSLDTSSPDFLHHLYPLFRHDEDERYLQNLQGSELARLVDFLDQVRALPLAFRQLRNGLRRPSMPSPPTAIPLDDVYTNFKKSVVIV